jgi:hypothetical protein
MALRTKTIEYAFISNNGITNANISYTFTSQTIYIPETSSRAFRSVILECSFRNTNTTAVNVTAPTLGIRLGTALINSQNMGNPVTNTGESLHCCLSRNVTNYLNTNF